MSELPKNPPDATTGFDTGEDLARTLDERDALAGHRSGFCFPEDEHGRPLVYFCGNSLGLQPKAARDALQQELSDWSRLAVDAHFDGATPWFGYHETLRGPLARLVGALPSEVVAMNGLTVNLHLMLVSFYRPTRSRHRILIEENAFPSDNYAVRSQIALHGFDPDRSLLTVGARDGESSIRSEDLERVIAEQGESIALILLGGVQYYSGQLFDMKRIAERGRLEGCVVGFDLAHAAGNVPLALHDWQVDFAVWCSYKYLNAGPGAVAGCFVHEAHHGEDLPRLAGWWGNDPKTRFRMHLEPEFVPVPSADAWQLSNPPILAAAPLRVSLETFDGVGMDALRGKSLRLNDYLLNWIAEVDDPRLRLLTPGEPSARGCQTSIELSQGGRELFAALREHGVVCDYREPGVIRVAPVPLYNSFHDIWRFGRALAAWAGPR